MLRLVGSAVARRSSSLSGAAVRTFAAMPEPQTQPDVLYTGVSVLLIFWLSEHSV